MHKPLKLISLGALVWGGCALYSTLPPEERQSLRSELTVKESEAYLRISYFVTGFFGDPSRKLITPLSPAEVPIVYGRNDHPLPSVFIEQVLPAGTPVTIVRVEFPTSWRVAGRPAHTPRAYTWVYLEPGHGRTVNQDSVPWVLVLPFSVRSKEEFLASLRRYLTPIDPAPIFAHWSSSVRTAVRAKAVMVDMPADAAEAAVGYPEAKHAAFEGDLRKEEWVYPGGHRIIFLASGRVIRVEPSQE